jgi:general secretion pathway protein C
MMGLCAMALAAGLEGPPADLQAVGAVTSRDQARSVAMLRTEGHSRLVSVGETAFGGRVVAIGPDAVTLEYGGRRVDLRLTPGPARLAAAPVRPPIPPPADPSAPGRDMERHDVERRLAQEVPRILAETTAVPVMDGGHVAGLALTHMPESSLLTDAGLQAGDVLTEVNGTPIDSLASLMSLYPRLQSESTLRAVVLRNGQPVALTVNLR